MLRLVIQISMVLALFVMAVLPVHLRRAYAAWYISYVLLFNMLVGPVFSAGSVTSERERQTLDLLLDDAGDAVADAVGQAALGAAGVERADVVSAVAGAVGVRDAAAVLVTICRRWLGYLLIVAPDAA